MIKRDFDIELIEDIPISIKNVLIQFFKKTHRYDVIDIDYIRIMDKTKSGIFGKYSFGITYKYHWYEHNTMKPQFDIRKKVQIGASKKYDKYFDVLVSRVKLYEILANLNI
jgi:hypothetical protein